MENAADLVVVGAVTRSARFQVNKEKPRTPERTKHGGVETEERRVGSDVRNMNWAPGSCFCDTID